MKPLRVWVNHFCSSTLIKLVLQQNMGQCAVFFPRNHCGLQALVFMHLIKKTKMITGLKRLIILHVYGVSFKRYFLPKACQTIY